MNTGHVWVVEFDYGPRDICWRPWDFRSTKADAKKFCDDLAKRHSSLKFRIRKYVRASK